MGQEQRKKLTEAERGVLALVKDEPLTIKQISRRRKTSKQATAKLVKSMIQKGYVRHIGTLVVAYTYGAWGMPEKTTIAYKGNSENHPIRLHGEVYRIEVLKSSDKWLKVGVAKSIVFEGNTLVVYRDCIMVFSLQTFEGADPDDCDAQAVRYWRGFFHGIERRYDIRILKERSENIKRVKAHYAEEGNELASDLRRKGERKVRIFGSRDGKEWLLFDDSFHLDEAETTHSPTPKDERTAKEDMQNVVQPFFNDLRDHSDKIPLPSQQVAIMAKQQDITASMLEILQKQMVVNAQVSETVTQQNVMSSQTNTAINQIAQILMMQYGIQKPEESPKPDQRGDKPSYLG